MPNFVQICAIVKELSATDEIQNGGGRHLGFNFCYAGPPTTSVCAPEIPLKISWGSSAYFSRYRDSKILQIWLKMPNSIMPTSTETSPRGKSWTQSMKVADKNNLDMSRCLRQSPWQVRDKPVCVALMEFSPLQCMGKVGDKVHDKRHKSQIMKFSNMICVADFMICVCDKVRDFGIWA